MLLLPLDQTYLKPLHPSPKAQGLQQFRQLRLEITAGIYHYSNSVLSAWHPSVGSHLNCTDAVDFLSIKRGSKIVKFRFVELRCTKESVFRFTIASISQRRYKRRTLYSPFRTCRFRSGRKTWEDDFLLRCNKSCETPYPLRDTWLHVIPEFWPA